MFEPNYCFFHHWLLFCRCVMFQQNSILSKPKWGAQAAVRGDTPLWTPVATALLQTMLLPGPDLRCVGPLAL